MAGLYYATPDGTVTKQDAKDGNPRLGTNGIILTPDEKHVIVTNAGTLAILDVGPDGQLSNQRKFADLDRTGLAEGQGAGGDGSCFDADGRFYVTAANGVQGVDKNGKHLGNIPAPAEPGERDHRRTAAQNAVRRDRGERERRRKSLDRKHPARRERAQRAR